MKTAKIGVLFLVSIMALAGTSAGYALWFDDLTIDGTINTGTFNVDWSIDAVHDDEEAGKDVSSIAAVMDNIEGVKTMTVTLTNAYPCINYYVDFDLLSIGTVPAHFTDWVITKPDYVDISITPLNVAGEDQLQLHENGHFYGTLHIHLTNAAPEGQTGTITFTITTRAHQYNEDSGF